MRSLVIAIINAVCRPIDAYLTRQQNRLNGDDDALQALSRANRANHLRTRCHVDARPARRVIPDRAQGHGMALLQEDDRNARRSDR